ncbi:MAG: hypothetical protein JNL13_09210 [Chitinophagaceae bacterium]|nr:hypothetical protein [Chitinophagaceae bacterium]
MTIFARAVRDNIKVGLRSAASRPFAGIRLQLLMQHASMDCDVHGTALNLIMGDIAVMRLERK